MFKYLSLLKPARYVACDIAEKLLSRHPNNAGKVEKVICDLEDTLPFDDESFDLATSFFVLEHIEDIESLFNEVYRILKI
jgi:ubiquinone/menaquinone biosynthesis C-methylase UbiE